MKTRIKSFLVAAIISSVIQSCGTLKTGTITDIDNQMYETVVIGEQIWMRQNLNVSRFRNGDIISQAQSREKWKEANENEEPAWCYYKNDTVNNRTYGKLYNWYAVNDPRGIAPKGWRVPSSKDFAQLERHVKSQYQTLGALRSNKYLVSEINNSDTTMFSAIPSGYRSMGEDTIAFYKRGVGTFYWLRDVDKYSMLPLGVVLLYRGEKAYVDNHFKGKGFALRCIKETD